MGILDEATLLGVTVPSTVGAQVGVVHARAPTTSIPAATTSTTPSAEQLLSALLIGGILGGWGLLRSGSHSRAALTKGGLNGCSNGGSQIILRRRCCCCGCLAFLAGQEDTAVFRVVRTVAPMLLAEILAPVRSRGAALSGAVALHFLFGLRGGGARGLRRA